MQALAWIVRIAIVIVLVWFAARNSQPVTLHGMPGEDRKSTRLNSSH